MTGEKLVYEDGWFQQVNLDLELDKIYVFELQFKDGDYVKYTFNTKSTDRLLFMGEYSYNIYEEGQLKLLIEEDKFNLYPFEYFDKSIENNASVITGSYEFLEQDEKIVLEIGPHMLFLNFDKTTFDISQYNIKNKGQFTYRD